MIEGSDPIDATASSWREAIYSEGPAGDELSDCGESANDFGLTEKPTKPAKKPKVYKDGGNTLAHDWIQERGFRDRIQQRCMRCGMLETWEGARAACTAVITRKRERQREEALERKRRERA